MDTLVVDASVAVKGLIIEEGTPEARRLLGNASAGRAELVAPPLIRIEVANILWKRHSRGGLSLAHARRLMDDFLKAPISIDESFDLVSRALELACTAGCSVYDAAYLATALGHNCHLVTADRRQFEVAEKLLRHLSGKNILIPG